MGPGNDIQHMLYKLSDADLHAILNTIADKVQTHFAKNKVKKGETNSLSLSGKIPPNMIKLKL